MRDSPLIRKTWEPALSKENLKEMGEGREEELLQEGSSPNETQICEDDDAMGKRT